MKEFRPYKKEFKGDDIKVQLEKSPLLARIVELVKSDDRFHPGMSIITEEAKNRKYITYKILSENKLEIIEYYIQYVTKEDKANIFDFVRIVK